MTQFETIPPEYLPRNQAIIDHTSKSAINRSFLSDCKKLFMEHLTTVIQVNTITLEIKLSYWHVLPGKKSLHPNRLNWKKHPQPLAEVSPDIWELLRGNNLPQTSAVSNYTTAVDDSDTNTAFLYRRMKFLKNDSNKDQNPYLITSNRAVEDFIEGTKVALDLQMKQASSLKKHNVSGKEDKALRSLLSPAITIKPADKNIGIVILNSQDYVTQCLIHLSSKTYIRVAEFPNSNIKRSVENVLVNFRNQLAPHRRLYQYLQPPHKHTTPKFYGLPKIYKPLNEEGIPPMRPIISHVDSLLSRTAHFVDHVLQPLAQSYTDYIKNSTQLIQILENIEIREEVTLITMDVVSLYLSIPQQECLKVIHSEMCKFSDLIIFDPNLITQLLQVNMNNNFFTFADIPFQQIEGTAMGAAFLPSIVNIYMSVLLKSFLSKRSDKPLLIKRYIDDIFMIWQKHHDLNKFVDDINSYHPNIKFTFTQSDSAVEFLDITVYKGEDTEKLKVSTFQKENNLHQYLHFSSSHPKSVFRGIIIEEATRYV
uniref:Reverse transcriptase domain-containing protein n=1 Tax=Amphimedon queenslandica TaxID=400682 RepID=A0A1X7U709_AMPQE